MPRCQRPNAAYPWASMEAFSSAAEGWCSLQSSRSSSATLPSATSFLAWSYPGLCSFTAMVVRPPLLDAVYGERVVDPGLFNRTRQRHVDPDGPGLPRGVTRLG